MVFQPKFQTNSPPCLLRHSCQYRILHETLSPPSHLLPSAVLHLFLLRSDRESSLPLPPGQRHLSHQAFPQHERPVRCGGQTQKKEQAKEQTPKWEHQLVQWRHGEWRGRGEESTDTLIKSVPVLWFVPIMFGCGWATGKFSAFHFRWKPQCAFYGSPCSRCLQSFCACVSVTYSPGSLLLLRLCFSPTSWDKSSTTEIPR